MFYLYIDVHLLVSYISIIIFFNARIWDIKFFVLIGKKKFSGFLK